MQKTKSEAVRYFENAKELLGKSSIEGDRYEDKKYVQEACGTAYLAILKILPAPIIFSGICKMFRRNEGQECRILCRFNL